MKILFLSKYYSPHIGGVEKHVEKISKSLERRGHEVTILTEKYKKNLKSEEVVGRIKVFRIKRYNKKILGLFSIWFTVWKERKLIKEADIIHIHDIFVWYLPFRLIYPLKPVFTTFHGWEGIFPVPLKNIVIRKLSAKLSNGTIVIGHYIEKYYRIKADKIIYGGK